MFHILLAVSVLALGALVCASVLRNARERKEDEAAKPARIPVRDNTRRPDRRS